MKTVRLAKKQCRATMPDGTHCFLLFRSVPVNSRNQRTGPVKCLNGHKVTGIYASLVHKMPVKKK